MDKFNRALKNYNVAMRTSYDCLKNEQIVLAILPTGFNWRKFNISDIVVYRKMYCHSIVSVEFHTV